MLPNPYDVGGSPLPHHAAIGHPSSSYSPRRRRRPPPSEAHIVKAAGEGGSRLLRGSPRVGPVAGGLPLGGLLAPLPVASDVSPQGGPDGSAPSHALGGCLGGAAPRVFF